MHHQHAIAIELKEQVSRMQSCIASLTDLDEDGRLTHTRETLRQVCTSLETVQRLVATGLFPAADTPQGSPLPARSWSPRMPDAPRPDDEAPPADSPDNGVFYKIRSLGRMPSGMETDHGVR